MNKYIYSIFLLAFSSVLLSSCGTLSVTKRVHNNGYQVSYTKHYAADSKNDEAIVKKDTQSSNSEVEEIQAKTGNVTRIDHTDPQVQTARVLEANTETAATLKTSNSIVPKTKKDNLTELTSSFKPTNVLFSDDASSSTIKNIAPVRDSGLSMLWIVIIIILILWLLGYLGGLGSFIHLLLIIALILLILWLLQII